jgi:hypothetical protein
MPGILMAIVMVSKWALGKTGNKQSEKVLLGQSDSTKHVLMECRQLVSEQYLNLKHR